MSQRPDRATFDEVATEMSIDPAFVEKDWIVTQVIAILSELNHDGFRLVFSGGTALSKAHGLLERFSEDVDFRAIAPKEKPSAGELRSFKHAVIDLLKKAGFTIEEAHIRARDGNRFFAIDLEYESAYPKSQSLRPHVLVEISVRNIQLEAIQKPVSSFLNKLAKQAPEVKGMACIDPVESAADKLSALGWRVPDRVRNGEYDDPSLVRHIHDLARLKDRAMGSSAFKDLVVGSMTLDNTRAKDDAVNELTPAEKLAKMMDLLQTDKAYPAEYDQFVKSVSYAKDGLFPDFETGLASIRALIAKASS